MTKHRSDIRFTRQTKQNRLGGLRREYQVLCEANRLNLGVVPWHYKARMAVLRGKAKALHSIIRASRKSQ